ncbi:MAG: glucohydrolase [Caproiciproducens sp.]|nr:glucohydrolase [Caproiciproducens sp.]
MDLRNITKIGDGMAKNWWKESVIYQIYPRSFMDSNGDGIGDINGIISKLDYLKDLGVNVVWLCPVYKSPNDDNGYDISDYRDIMDEFGTLKDWERLVKEMHKRGLKLIMDLVVNHSSDEHKWFIESKKSKDNPYRDYYIWRDGKEGNPPNNWQSCFSFSAWQYDETTGQYYLHLFSKKQPDLNWANPKVRGEVFDLMKFWLDKGVDGFRMDVINAIGKPDSFDTEWFTPDDQKTHRYLQEMNQKVLSHYDIMTVGETGGVTPETASLFTADDRNELNMVFHFELMDADGGKWTPNRFKLMSLKEILSKWQTQLDHKAWNSLYLNNHDQPRMVSRFGDDEKYRVQSAQMLATMLHTMQGTPYIYQGEEIGMTNVPFTSLNDFKDIETLNWVKESLAKGKTAEELLPIANLWSRDNARTPMQWNDTENAGFTTGIPWIQMNPNYQKINVRNDLEKSDSIFHYYQKLIQLRHQYDVIVYGDFHEYFNDNEQIYCYTRTLEHQRLIVFLNFTADVVDLTLPKELSSKKAVALISNYDEKNDLKSAQISLQPYEAVVYLEEQ